MKNSIILAFSIIAATIVPSILTPDAAFAQSGVDTTSCGAMSREPKATIDSPTAPLGTAKDLILGGPQKVNTRCFFSVGPFSDPDEQRKPIVAPIVVELPKTDRLELIRISF